MQLASNNRREQRRNKKSTRKTRFEMSINMYVSIITLNVNELNAPIKRTKWQTGLKHKSLEYAACSMRPTLGQRTHIDGK